MKNIGNVSVVLCILVCSACSHRVTPVDHTVRGLLRSPLDTVTQGLIYDTQIRVQRRQFSGLMFLRQVGPDVWRIAVTAKIGQTLLDVELTPTTMTLRRSVSQLERRFVLTHLERDLRLLTGSLAQAERIKSFDHQGSHVIEKIAGTKGWWHRLRRQDGTIAENAWGGKASRKSRVRYGDFEQGIPGTITIDHRTIVNFDIRMHRVPEEGK